MSVNLSRPGLATFLVDGGRLNCRSLGVPVGGPADPLAMRFANRLLRNATDAACLEVTLAGPTITTTIPVGMAFFGADFLLTLDQQPRPGGTWTLLPGQTLDIGSCRTGSRGYLAVVGGFQMPPVLGSQTSFEALVAGTTLACAPSQVRGRALPIQHAHEVWTHLLEIPRQHEPGILRALPGTQADWFDDTFWQRSYTVSAMSNRMGIRLNGEPLSKPPREMVSEAVAPGAVQITNDGMPIILGVDGQTIGGYPKVAHVIRHDLPLLGQLRPGQPVRFQPVDLLTVAYLNRQLNDDLERIDQYFAAAIR